jgi:ribosomal subunit interface protein
MNIQITVRHSKASQSLRDALTEELLNLEKYAENITSVHAVIDTEHVDKTVEIVVNLSRHTVSATGKADVLGKAIDMALHKVIAQLKKVNQKRKEHKGRKSMDIHESAIQAKN